MKTVLHAIFEGEIGEEAHSDFLKFSRGVFADRYLVEAKKQKDSWSIKTGPEYANFLVRACLEKAKGKVNVNGIITATFDVSGKAQFQIAEVKNAMGIKKAIINTETEPEKILSLMREFPRAFFALSFSTATTTLKIKAKAPKNAKPSSNGGKEPKAEFCSVKTTDQELVSEILFEVPEVKAVAIKHEINITDIDLPKGLTNPVEIREKSKRKGTIKRIVTVDGKQTVSEAKFFA
jgi:hypothetical protein